MSRCCVCIAELSVTVSEACSNVLDASLYGGCRGVPLSFGASTPPVWFELCTREQDCLSASVYRSSTHWNQLVKRTSGDSGLPPAWAAARTKQPWATLSPCHSSLTRTGHPLRGARVRSPRKSETWCVRVSASERPRRDASSLIASEAPIHYRLCDFERLILECDLRQVREPICPWPWRKGCASPRRSKALQTAFSCGVSR